MLQAAQWYALQLSRIDSCSSTLISKGNVLHPSCTKVQMKLLVHESSIVTSQMMVVSGERCTCGLQFRARNPKHHFAIHWRRPPRDALQ